MLFGMSRHGEAIAMLNLFKSKKGSILVLFAVSMTTLIGLGSLVVDIGYGRILHQKLQIVVDSAALAAVREVDIYTLGKAVDVASKYVSLNGLKLDDDKLKMSVKRVDGSINKLEVVLRAKRPAFFNSQCSNVSARAVAEFYSFVEIPVSDDADYGIVGDDTPIFLSCRGRGNPVEWSDLFNSRWLDPAGKTPNPYYKPTGQDYYVNIPDDYAFINSGESRFNVEIFDMDNSDGTNGNGNDPLWGDHRIVEGQITMYTLISPDGTIIAQAKVGRCKVANGQWSLLSNSNFGSFENVEWVIGNSFQVDVNLFGTGKYKLNVQPDPDLPDDKGVNDYLLRAGPPGYNYNDKQSELIAGRENGTSISGIGRLTVSRRTTGLASVYLGNVPASAAGSNLDIINWDLDLGSPRLEYVCVDNNGNEILRQNGNPAGNANLVTDTIAIPSDYIGGKWYAEYSSGANDTSTWMIYYDGISGSGEGFAALVE